MKQFAVMGNPVDHSLSPFIHQKFAQSLGINIVYEKLLVAEDDFENQVDRFFKNNGFGLNITLPFKKRAFYSANKTTARCQQAEAANTLWLEKGSVVADNTDGIGFMQDICQKVSLIDKKVLILGAGGAAQGIIGPLLAAPLASLTITNRDLNKAYDLQKRFALLTVKPLDLLGTYDLIINATSLNHSYSEQFFSTITHSLSFCYDLNYNILNSTWFIRLARARGYSAWDGLGMLIEQAAKAFSIWHGIYPDVKPVKEFFELQRDNFT